MADRGAGTMLDLAPVPEPPASQIVVQAEHAGTRLDRFLAASVGSRSQAEALIRAGRVRVDGRARSKSHLLAPGDRVTVAPPPPHERQSDEAQPASYSIAYEDQRLLIVDKPAGVVVHPARGNWTGTLAQALAGRAAGGEDPARPGIVHRLDRDTSGLLVVAKDEETHRALKALLSRRELHREYVTLVDGVPPARSGTIDAPIGRHRRDRVLMSIDTDHPREARTHFELERVLHDCAQLRVLLDTGRTHQIRVHLAAVGHPVLGDHQYGGPDRYGLRRQFLHAQRLRFAHPFSGRELDVRSALPEDLAAALALAEREAEQE
jgi:23S rRNA pseudouridine1911/1915/1917 synthase